MVPQDLNSPEDLVGQCRLYMLDSVDLQISQVLLIALYFDSFLHCPL